MINLIPTSLVITLVLLTSLPAITLDRDRVQRDLYNLHPLATLVLPDSSYETVSTPDILRAAEQYNAELIDRGISYTENSFDCEDYAGGLVAFFKQRIAQYGVQSTHAPLVGVLYYPQDVGLGHALVIYAEYDHVVRHIRYQYLEVTLSQIVRQPFIKTLTAREKYNTHYILL
jgi:hypothetical protein